MAFILLVVIGFLTGKLFAFKAFQLQRKIVAKTPLKKFHIHHSLVGLSIVLFGIFVSPTQLSSPLVGFGSGLSLHHFLTEGFQFISFK